MLALKAEFGQKQPFMRTRWILRELILFLIAKPEQCTFDVHTPMRDSASSWKLIVKSVS
jgi:hypothetical protein